MPIRCCVVNCKNAPIKGLSVTNGGLHFYKMPCKKTPFEERRREDWIRALKRHDWKTWEYEKISEQRVCSAHFISGERSDDTNDPDWVPNIFDHNAKTAVQKGLAKRQRQKRHEVLQEKRFPLPLMALPSTQATTATSATCLETIDPAIDLPVPLVSHDHSYICMPMETDVSSKECGIQVDNSEMDELTKQFQKLEIENKKLKASIEKLKKNSKLLRFKKVSNDEDIKFYTGLPSVPVFNFVVDIIRPHIMPKVKCLTLHDQVMLVLMKLRLASLHQDIANQFGVSEATVSISFRQLLPIMSRVLRSLIVWPAKDKIRHNLPKCFEKNYRDAVTIIDCSEIFIERPSNPTTRAKSWSNYKHNNTIKYLLGVSPVGSVMFLSRGWGGRASDKQITNESGFLDRISHGDCVLADRGFLIESELNERGATLKIPNFLKGGALSKEQTHTSSNLSRVRIHVERVIGRMKTYRIIHSIIPISIVDLLDDIMIVICGCINLNKSVVPLKPAKK